MVKPWFKTGLLRIVDGAFWFLVRDIPEDGILVGSSQVAASLAEVLVVEQLAMCCRAAFPPPLAPNCPDCPPSASFSISGDDEGQPELFSGLRRCDKISVTPTVEGRDGCVEVSLPGRSPRLARLVAR
jgi:hypothetical protein